MAGFPLDAWAGRPARAPGAGRPAGSHAAHWASASAACPPPPLAAAAAAGPPATPLLLGHVHTRPWRTLAWVTCTTAVLPACSAWSAGDGLARRRGTMKEGEIYSQKSVGGSCG